MLLASCEERGIVETITPNDNEKKFRVEKGKTKTKEDVGGCN